MATYITVADVDSILGAGWAAAELKAKQESAAKAAAAKKTTITCTKGKLTRKITAVRPKCPSGFTVKK